MKKTSFLIFLSLITLFLTACNRNSQLPEATREIQDSQSESLPTTTEENSPNTGFLARTTTDKPTPPATESIPEIQIERNGFIIESHTEAADSIVIVQVGDCSFEVKLLNNASTQELLARIPIAVNMSELNGNEKYYYLSDDLPTNPEHVEHIHAGELMLYGSDCLVLFYKDFETSYSYTRLGYMEDASGLASTIGTDNVQILFAIEG